MADSALVALPKEFLGGDNEWSQELDHHVKNFYYYGENHTVSANPQGFLATRDPGNVTQAHFHHINQYQVFFGAPGATFQRHEIGRLLVHYTDGETVYGPFAAGGNGLRFLTLRPYSDGFTGNMPEAKDELLPRATRRHHEVQLDEWLDEELPPPGEAITDDIISHKEDGLVAVKVAAGPGAHIASLDPLHGDGQYIVVVGGSVLSGDDEFATFALGWRYEKDGPADLVAGAKGARVLFLQFPHFVQQ